MRLIDADEMLDNEQIAYIKAQSSKTISAMTRDVNKAVHAKIQMLIADTPTVEAKPVVHGEWIPRNPNNEDSERYCSNCKAEISAIKAMYYKFCPECGCNMRGKKND